MSLTTRKRVILAKTESVYGTDPTPTGSANAILVRNLEITPIEAEQVSRDLVRDYLGNSDTLIAQKSVIVTFEVELAGSGVAGTAPKWGPLLKACGFGETLVALTSVTYAPVSASFGSVTIYYNVDGILHKITGARGTFEMGLSVKQIPTLKFTFTGIYNDPTDTALPTTDYSGFVAPKVANTANTTSFSFLSYSALLESISIDIANDIQYRTLVGSEAVHLVDRKPAGSCVIEAPTIAAKDYFSVAEAGSTGALSLVHDSGAGRIITVTAPRVSIGGPTYQDSQGIQMLSIPFVLAPSSGNDEISIALT